MILNCDLCSPDLVLGSVVSLDLSLNKASCEWSEGLVQEIMLRISNSKFERVDFDMNVLHSENRGAIML